MTNNIIFIDRTSKIELPLIDKKKYLIENQKVISKKRCKKIVSTKRAACQGNINNHLFEFIKMRKSSLLFICSCLMIFFSLVPLFLNINSFFWEKKRVLQKENDILYNLFVIEGIEERRAGSRTDLNELHVVPSLKMRTYKVKKGDSLFGISRKFNISVDEIITANNLKNAHYLTIGKVLKIPNMSGIFCTVKKGDNLSNIARKYGVSVNEVVDINDLSSSVIQVGQRLFIRGGALTAWDRAALIGTIFKTPVKGRITSRMGFRIDPFTKRMSYHAGIDIANRVGTPVCAAQYGRVIFTGYNGNYGKTVVIIHPHGYKTIYSHLHKITVKRGQAVQQGEKIGLLGNSGRSTGPHLHFEVHQNNKLLDPMKVVKMR